MKIVLDLKTYGAMRENDVIIFHNGQWQVVSKEIFLNEVIKENKALKKELAETKQSIIDMKAKFNEKLEEQHKVLQVLTKGE